jgi:3-polyprenyl-4-hydroxybenzoate decarboxylase
MSYIGYREWRRHGHSVPVSLVLAVPIWIWGAAAMFVPAIIVIMVTGGSHAD